VDIEVEALLGSIELAQSSDEKIWLLSSADYLEKDESAFAWNEWELQTLDAVENDLLWSAQIRQFWDGCLPIALSVADGYAYYAVRQDGTFIYGREPEFEEFEVIATSLSEFLQRLAVKID
jgi:hypothetical protein